MAGPMTGLQLCGSAAARPGAPRREPGRARHRGRRRLGGLPALRPSALATCSEIHLLPGWSNSRGAALEALCAHTLGMTITYGFAAERVELVDALQVVQPLAAQAKIGGAA